MFGRPVPAERPDRPFTGFKLAQPVLSADGRRAAFAGLSIGAHRVYGVIAEASCVWNRRHAPPKRRCGCGFYCLSSLAEATALACVTEHQAAVVLEVAASGRFIRYERGLRYSRQRVRAVRVGRCRCGRHACGLVGNGSGFAGWCYLAAACTACVADRPRVTFRQLAASLGGAVTVRTDIEDTAGTAFAADTAGTARVAATAGPPDTAWTRATDGPRSAGEAADPAGARPASVAVLAAEVALVQARLDDLQVRLARFYGGPPAAP